MNLKKIFGTSDAITPEEKKKLEGLDNSCQELHNWLIALPKRMATSREDRRARLATSAQEFAQAPTSTNFDKLMMGTWQQSEEAEADFGVVSSALKDAVTKKMEPQNEIITEILKRHLWKLEKQHENYINREQKESLEFGIEFKPSGIIRGLEGKILELRNRIHNGNHGHWKEALAELL